MTVPQTLAISEIKITGDEFVVIQNNTTAAIDVTGYWLYEFNNVNPQAAGASSSTQQLPAAKLDSGQALLLSDIAQNTCGAELAGKLSLSLGDSGGSLEILGSANGLIATVPADFVSWSSGASGQIPNVPSSSKDPKGVYYRTAGGWQLADLDPLVPCQLDISAGGVVNTAVAKAAGAVPSVVVTAGSNLPGDDSGLVAPQLSEILPNPAAPQTDANDEFIELYNPNSKPFDLGNFTLQVGLATTHKYTFPDNTFVQPQQFAVFYSSDTGLSLSNSGGQVELLDPAGNVVEQSDVYSTAKDNYAWIYADGKWQWTTKPTPGAKNIVIAPAAAKRSSGSSGKKAVLAATTGSNSGGPGGGTLATAPSSLHPAILAGIGSLALLYALYEYRHDLAAALYRFRRYRAARRGAG